MALGFTIDIDAREFGDLLDRLRANMTEAQFKNAMYGIFKRTGGHVRKILKSDLPHEYHVKPGEIGKAVANPRVTSGGLGVGCIIPVRAPRKSIGGGFSASGGAHGWNSLRRKYRVKARVVKSGVSTLPARMPSYGGMPPFRNLGSKLGGLTFTREGRARLPIRKVEGIAIPQMPMTRSQPEVQGDIKAYLEKEIMKRLAYLIAAGK